MFTYVDVISRAIEIINRGEPPFSWSYEGGCCPWCAISKAKGELDVLAGTSLSLLDTLRFMREEVESDDPLVFARHALAQWNDVDPCYIDKKQAIEILSQAKKVIVMDYENQELAKTLRSPNEFL